MNKKILAAAMLAVVAGSFFAAGNIFSVTAGAGEQLKDGVNAQDIVCSQVTRADGTVEPQYCTYNALTNAGRQMMVKYLMGENAKLNNVTTLVISNSTGALAGGVTDTSLVGANLLVSCGLGNTTANMQMPNATAYVLDWQWTNTCAFQIVNTTALYNASSTGNGYADSTTVMFAGANLTPSTLQPTDKINVTYTVNIG